MEPRVTGTKYDNIAQWWQQRHINSSYGIQQCQRALQFAANGGKALDVGCGAGGRFIRLLEEHNYHVTGLDASKAMVALAKANHPQHEFKHQDICTWQTGECFDFIMAWDSLFHLPLAMQKPVLTKLCQQLKTGGVLFYTFGNAEGEHTDQWHNDTFYYSSIGIKQNIQTLLDNGLKLMHLELDQYPEKHVYIIGVKD